jgi:hypothetical protein
VQASKDVPNRGSAYLWWILANLLALCFAVTSWMACLHVFENPEIPRNYELLKRLGRVPEIRRYTVLDVPNGSSLDPRGLYARFFSMSGEKRDALNTRLLRNYLTNFERPLAMTYIEGEYRIEGVRLLSKGDFIAKGFVVRARAVVRPDENSTAAPYPVVIDYLFPSNETGAAAFFRKGDLLDVRKSPNCAVVLHVDLVEDKEEDEEWVCVTVVPIAYGPYQVGKGGGFEIAPPEFVSPGARFPVF